MLIPNQNSGSAFAKALRVARSPDFLQQTVACVFVMYLVACGIRRKERKSHHQRVTREARLVLMVVTVSCMVGIAKQLPDFAQNLRESRDGTADTVRLEWIGRPALLEAAQHLRSSTDEKSLVAVTLCSGENENCIVDYSLAAYSRRRFLTMWPPYWSSGSLEDLDAARSIVSDFNRPDSIVQYWISREVDYGVIDKSLVDENVLTTSTSEEAIVFENSQYLILDLEKT
jgi:hypothetical protein